MSKKAIRSHLKRIEEKKKIVLDPFNLPPYSSAPLASAVSKKMW